MNSTSRSRFNNLMSKSFIKQINNTVEKEHVGIAVIEGSILKVKRCESLDVVDEIDKYR